MANGPLAGTTEKVRSDPVTSAPDARLRSGIVDRAAHPINLAVPVVAVAFFVLWKHHLIASISFWAILTTLLAAEGASLVAFGLWGQAREGWRLWALVGADLGPSAPWSTPSAGVRCSPSPSFSVPPT